MLLANPSTEGNKYLSVFCATEDSSVTMISSLRWITNTKEHTSSSVVDLTQDVNSSVEELQVYSNIRYIYTQNR